MFLRQTSVTFGEAKEKVARASGSQNNTAQVALVGDSIQAAFRFWNAAANWKWLQTSTDITTAQGDDTYTLPPLIKNVHSVVVPGAAGRPLIYCNRNFFNKMIAGQTESNIPWLYDLYNQEHGSSAGIIKLYPVPGGEETIQIDYYRRMVLPCTVTGIDCRIIEGTYDVTLEEPISGATIGSLVTYTVTGVDDPWEALYPTITAITQNPASITVSELALETDVANAVIDIGGDDQLLDCPEDYVEGILAWATHHYLINKAGSPRLEFWQQYAQAELDRALRNNMQETPDEEILMLPAEAFAIPYLGPNDIRWAERGW